MPSEPLPLAQSLSGSVPLLTHDRSLAAYRPTSWWWDKGLAAKVLHP